eukprot:4499380-Pleurochrysis_carterae.AAC.1
MYSAAKRRLNMAISTHKGMSSWTAAAATKRPTLTAPLKACARKGGEVVTKQTAREEFMLSSETRHFSK